ncbi:MAG TPA: hypothetical protein VH372_21460 [Actinospica sp.]|jgi:ABC-type amino acid transport substrate-binding protein|nr:hypothetical protein [Actinospica sp.]
MIETIFRHGADISLNTLAVTAPIRIATLGPRGTSSEAAATELATTLAFRGHETVRVLLSDSYEEAAAEVLEDRANLMLVANAYAGVSEFYMNPRFQLAAVFVKDTPNYGLASLKPLEDGEGPMVVASHPAPIPLIDELLPDGLAVAEVVTELSTSAAAEAAASGRVDAALTTLPAATLHGLTFFSRTRPIRMLWSVFKAAEQRARIGERRGLRPEAAR